MDLPDRNWITGLQAGFFVYQKADWELKTGTKSALVAQCGI